MKILLLSMLLLSQTAPAPTLTGSITFDPKMQLQFEEMYKNGYMNISYSTKNITIHTKSGKYLTFNLKHEIIDTDLKTNKERQSALMEGIEIAFKAIQGTNIPVSVPRIASLIINDL